MDFVTISRDNDLAEVRLNRGKVHAINDQVVDELRDAFKNLENDSSVRAIILTGTDKFFSFGFDIPGFMDFSPEAFTRFVTNFTSLCTYLFLYPKPIVAAINGHAIAGGCILATTADYRIMVTGKARISLNEVTFGSSIFAGSVEMLRFSVGQRNAEVMLTTGAMYSAEEAHQMGLIDRVTDGENLMNETERIALEYAAKENPAFVSLKNLLRKPVVEEIKSREKGAIREFVKIWYSEKTRACLKKIEIRS
jgi:enoyl-CoA hydratase/carnithine racemase